MLRIAASVSAVGGEGRAIAAALAGADRPALDDLRLDARDLADMAVGLASRHAAVKREAGPDEVEAIFAAEADAGAVGEAVALRRHRRRRLRGSAPAARVQRLILVGAGEMAVQRLDREPVEQRRSRRCAGRAGSCRCRPSRRTAGPARSFQRATCSGLLSTGRAAEPSAASISSGPTPCSTDELAPSGKRPQRVGLRPGRDEEVAAARLEQASAASRAPSP